MSALSATVAAAQRDFDRRLPSDHEKTTDASDIVHARMVRFWKEEIRKDAHRDNVWVPTHWGLRNMASEVFGRMEGEMTTEQWIAIGRAVLCGDKDAVFELMKAMTDKAIELSAESFAKD